MLTGLTQRLLDWYSINARSLPWRVHPGRLENNANPYRIWISEVMLQQTQVDTVIPYYARWLDRFPTLADLAAASEQDVLSLWEGLGYYSRARNLHKAARVVVAEFGGSLPAERHVLESLPGIGRYTAAAIASIAFGQDEAALDGNIRRVLARLFGIRLPAGSPEGEKILLEFAVQNLPPGRAGDYNQALMDLGATICTPRSPACANCPLADLCAARAMGVQEELPLRRIRPVLPHYVVTAAVIKRDGLVLIARRPSKGLLGGLWEFPGGKQQDGESLPGCLQRELQEELGIGSVVGHSLGVYRHTYTHFKVTLHAFSCAIVSGEPQALQASALQWVTIPALADFPMGKIDRQISLYLASL